MKKLESVRKTDIVKIEMVITDGRVQKERNLL